MEVSAQKKVTISEPSICCMLIFPESTNKTVLAIYKEESLKGVWEGEK
jgi:hypothetical protein